MDLALHKLKRRERRASLTPAEQMTGVIDNKSQAPGQSTHV